MSGIKDYSTTAATNNSAAPNGFPEGMLPGDVNNAARQVMADIRAFYESAAFIDLGHTPTYASTTTFTVPGDVTAYYIANRRIKCTDASTLYGKISSSSYSDPDTTVTVSLDSGSLSASLTAVAVGLIDPTNYPVPAESLHGGASLTTGAFSGAVTLASTLSSTKAAATGYTRVTPNYCRRTSVPDFPSSSTNSDNSVNTPGDWTITAPSGAKIIRIRLYIFSDGSSPVPWVIAYNESGRTTIADACTAASAYSGYLPCIMEIPVISGTSYLTLTGSDIDQAYAIILGYYD